MYLTDINDFICRYLNFSLNGPPEKTYVKNTFETPECDKQKALTWVSTVTEDGSPHLAPVCFVMSDHVAFHGQLERNQAVVFRNDEISVAYLGLFEEPSHTCPGSR